MSGRRGGRRGGKSGRGKPRGKGKNKKGKKNSNSQGSNNNNSSHLDLNTQQKNASPPKPVVELDVFLGLDIGSSAIKVAAVQGNTISGLSDLSKLESLFLSESNNAASFHSKINLLADDMGHRCIPSVFTILDDKHQETLIGSEAVKSSIRNYKSCIYHSKHLISLSQHNESKDNEESLDRDRFETEFRTWKKSASKFGMHKALMTPYFDDDDDAEENVENGGDGNNEQKQNGKAVREHLKLQYRINQKKGGNFKEHLIDFAFVSMLQKIFGVISAQCASKKLHIVSAVPYYWTSSQIEYFKSLLFQSGFNPLQIIRQHAASILAINLDNHCNKTTQRVIAIDFGTFESTFSVVHLSNGFLVKNHSENTHCKTDEVSGMALDEMLLKWLIKDFQNRNRGCYIEIEDSKSRLKLFKELTRIKGVLSAGKHSVRFDIESLYEGIDYHFELSKAKFESIIYDVLSAIPKWIESTIKTQNINLQDVDHVIVSGGLAEMPKVQQSLNGIFGDKLRSKELAAKGIAANFVTVYGCAVEATSLSYLSQFQAEMMKSGGHQALREVLQIGNAKKQNNDGGKGSKSKKNKKKQQQQQNKSTEKADFVERNAFLNDGQDHQLIATSKQVSLCYIKGNSKERKPLCVIGKMTSLPFTGKYTMEEEVSGETVFTLDVMDDDCKSVLDTMEQTMNVDTASAAVEVSWNERNNLSVILSTQTVRFELGGDGEDDDDDEEDDDEDEDDEEKDNDDDEENNDTLDID